MQIIYDIAYLARVRALHLQGLREGVGGTDAIAEAEATGNLQALVESQ